MVWRGEVEEEGGGVVVNKVLWLVFSVKVFTVAIPDPEFEPVGTVTRGSVVTTAIREGSGLVIAVC